MPVCPKCGKVLEYGGYNDGPCEKSTFGTPQLASDYSYLSADFQCSCGCEGTLYWDHKPEATIVS